MALIADYGTLLLLLACLFGFFMAWGVGATTVAAIQTSEVNDLFAFLAVAVFGALIGGRFFELRD